MSSTPPLLSPQEVFENLSKHTLIDVRGPDEWFGELGHIEGAKLVTLGEELTHYLKNSTEKNTYVFICRSGKRSDAATKEAISSGLTQSYNMEGGMISWNEQNLPVVTKTSC